MCIITKENAVESVLFCTRTDRYKGGGLASKFKAKTEKITGFSLRLGAGYFFMLLIITIINPIKLTMNKPKVSITIIES